MRIERGHANPKLTNDRRLGGGVFVILQARDTTSIGGTRIEHQPIREVGRTTGITSEIRIIWLHEEALSNHDLPNSPDRRTISIIFSKGAGLKAGVRSIQKVRTLLKQQIANRRALDSAMQSPGRGQRCPGWSGAH